MKRVIPILLLLLGLCWPASDARSGIRDKGLKLGVSYSRLSGDQIVDREFQAGPALGGFLVFDSSTLIAFTCELLYTRKGGKWTQVSTDSMGNETGRFGASYDIDYLEIPLLIRGQKDSGGPFLYSGGTFAFKLSSSLQTEDGGDPADADLGGIESTDYGVLLGGGYDFEVGKGKLILDLRYYIGIADIAASDDITVHNRAWTLLAGYAF